MLPNKILRGSRAIGRSGLLVKHFSSSGSWHQKEEFIFDSGKEVPETGKITGVTLPEFLFTDLGKWENAIAFECGATGRKYTHGQVWRMINGFATSLQDMKAPQLRRGDCLSVILPNIPEFAAVILGIMMAGCVVSPMNPNYSSEEFVKLFTMSETKAIVTAPELLPTIRPLAKGIPIISVGDGGDHKFLQMAATEPKPDRFLKGNTVDDDTLAILPFSSGTTGPPKGVELTHTNLVSNLCQQLSPHFTELRKFADGNPQDVMPGILPFFHIYGLNCVTSSSLKMGAKMITIQKFEPKPFIETIIKHRFRVMHLVPPILSFLVNSPDVNSQVLESIETVLGGAAPIGKTLILKYIEKSGRDVHFQQGYGMTEMSPVSHMLQKKFATKYGSVGRAVPSTKVKILDLETRQPLGPGFDGEVCLKGPQVMRGYYRNPKATEETITKDGWLLTGDIGHHDEDGNLYLVDRLKELIKVKGLQVAPAELEELLRMHPDVLDVAVIGVEDERAGELPRAYIVKKNPKGPTKEEDIHRFVSGKVAAFKELKGGVEFINEIPKSAAGKILRKDLKAMYKSKFEKK